VKILENVSKREQLIQLKRTIRNTEMDIGGGGDVINDEI
jgi:hypothetical protein